ncbi:hypothetical protein [Emticicia fluvialis]|uniref:hypothetical protein n=1 Tax=Emticicia fluvialis TaxID=2974474 RepID=UPI002165D1BC|nr:hypothetical protein [Emticicia fluvialis]
MPNFLPTRNRCHAPAQGFWFFAIPLAAKCCRAGLQGCFLQVLSPKMMSFKKKRIGCFSMWLFLLIITVNYKK